MHYPSLVLSMLYCPQLIKGLSGFEWNYTLILRMYKLHSKKSDMRRKEAFLLITILLFYFDQICK